MSKILVVVDMQNDFIDGSLGSKEAEAIVDRVVEKIENFDGRVIFTKDTHYDDYLETLEGKNLPVKHCIVGTDGWEFNPKITKAMDGKGNYICCIKGTFGSTELVNVLKKDFAGNIESIEFVGLCTDICVVSNALLVKAYFPEVPLSVDSSCCAGVTPEKHECALETMRSCQIDVY